MPAAPFSRRGALALGCGALLSPAASRGAAAPELTEENYRRWLQLIRPSAAELRWRRVRWHRSLSAAAAEARQLQRPILLWAMNGHPCGET